MRRRIRRASSDQLRLFAPKAPLHWVDLPAETRKRTIALLVRLLRQHAHAHRGSEVRDE